MTGHELDPLCVRGEQPESEGEQRVEIDVPARDLGDDTTPGFLMHRHSPGSGEHRDQLQQLARGDVNGKRLDDQLEGALPCDRSPR